VPRILVVDDHAIFRRRVVQAIAKSFPGATVDEAANGQQALTLAGTRRYALVLLDITMPGRGGLEVLREMNCHCRGVPVLMLSMHPEGEYADSAFQAGASGYLNKDSAPEELAGAIRTVMAGRRYASAPQEGDNDRMKRAADGNQ